MITSFNKRVYTHLLRLCENSSDVNLSGFSSEFSAEEMGAVTRLALDGRPVRINDSDAENCINIILSEADTLTSEQVSKSDPDMIKEYLAKLAENKGKKK